MLDRLLSRRVFLRAGLLGGAVLILPSGCGDARSGIGIPGSGRFLERAEYDTLEALLERLIPEDDGPGARSARVADYVDFLLGAFTVDPPRIYAAGPYSGRHGGEASFGRFLPLSRVKEIGWRTEIEGSRGIPEREFNGPVRGLQEIYRDGLAGVDALARERFGGGLASLSLERRTEVLRAADPAFVATAFEHAVEGMYAAPEYGGNADQVGWELARYEGDRQPVGYDRREVGEPYPEDVS